jgi:hypothetical protein
VTWTYSGDPSTSDRDACRYYVQDTDAAVPYMQDEEYDYLITTWMPRFDNIIGVASVVADVIANKYAGVVDVVADGVKAAIATLMANFRQVAVSLRSMYTSLQSTGEVDISNLMFSSGVDLSIEPTIFAVAMHDNPLAGQQNVWPISYWPEYTEGLNTYIG